MILLRKILFYICIVLYLIFCPMIILYALGYSFKPQSSQGGIVKTGIIFLSTTPPGADVFLNNRRFA